MTEAARPAILPFMDWRDEGWVLSARPHGETAVVASLLTPVHGRHVGVVPGGQSPRRAGLLQPGQAVDAVWRARLPDQLGTYTLEPRPGSAPGLLLEDGKALAALSAACALAEATLPEREPHPALYHGFCALIGALSRRDPAWPFAYIRWEIGLLGELGYGLTLDRCAVTGTADDLTHVSPRTGRAVCRHVATGYADRLLPLPSFLKKGPTGTPSPEAVAEGLALTGFFLNRHVFEAHHSQLPAARQRLAACLAAAAA